MLAQAQRTAIGHGWAWRLKQCNAEAIGEPGERQDLVRSFTLMHELPARGHRPDLPRGLPAAAAGHGRQVRPVTR
ncbi:MAG: class I SAM-dependent methyltransferase [Chromatiales bacterium]|jgi:hypothetical protein|nr:class I SAM-dependent methyltransferase [Chromatiales bacterium]